MSLPVTVGNLAAQNCCGSKARRGRENERESLEGHENPCTDPPEAVTNLDPSMPSAALSLPAFQAKHSVQQPP